MACSRGEAPVGSASTRPSASRARTEQASNGYSATVLVRPSLLSGCTPPAASSLSPRPSPGSSIGCPSRGTRRRWVPTAAPSCGSLRFSFLSGWPVSYRPRASIATGTTGSSLRTPNSVPPSHASAGLTPSQPTLNSRVRRARAQGRSPPSMLSRLAPPTPLVGHPPKVGRAVLLARIYEVLPLLCPGTARSVVVVAR